FGQPHSDKLVEVIQSKIQKEIHLQNQYLTLVEQNFDLLASGEASNEFFPTFIFDKNKLVHWSTSKINLKLENLAGLDSMGIISIAQSRFLYQRRILEYNKERFILVSLIPLVINYGLTNRYLNKTSNERIFASGIEIVDDLDAYGLIVNIKNGISIFIKVTNKNSSSSVSSVILMSLFFACLFLILYSLFQLANHFSKNNKFWTGFIILLVGNLGVRIFLISSSLPFAITGGDLFNSSIYVSSIFSSSLGDLTLNISSLLLLTIYVFNSRIYISEVYNELLSGTTRKVLNVLLYFFGFGILYSYGLVILDILANSQIGLDISMSIEFDYIRLTALLSIILSGLTSFLSIHIIYKVVFYNRLELIKRFVMVSFPPVLLISILAVLKGEYLAVVLACHLSYFLIIFIYDLPSRMKNFRFGSLLYVLSAILLFSIVGATTIYKGYERSELIEKQKFATKLLIDRDIEAEYLLGQITEKIKSDMIMNSKLLGPRVSISQIKDRVNQLFIHGYFSGYNVSSSIFDKDGIGLGKNTGLVYYSDVKKRFSSPQFATDFTDIFFESNFLATGRKRYLCFVELQRYNNLTGYIILELQQKKQVSKSVYPELLLDNRYFGNDSFNYAIFDKIGLVHSTGSFNYKADFSFDWIFGTDIFDQGLEKSGYHHYAVSTENKTIVITSKQYDIWAMLSNFSFLFLIFLMAATLLITFNTIFNYETIRSINFSTKILIYLGCAFAVPLLLVGAAILDTLNKSYVAEIDKSFQKQTVAMSEIFVDLISSFYTNEINRDALSTEVLKISRSSRTDINLYDVEGKLISTSQPKIIEANLLSGYINPMALAKLKNQNRDNIVIEESLGNLAYKSSFVAIRSFDEGKLIGIMSSPYFSSKNHLNRQQTEVFMNIINISTIIFLLSVGLSYVAVRRLINPIMLIASKLKKTELSEDNSPLEWNSNDEIGVLVQEYNSMVEKLEFSKKELARNEKEAAWREMAKQVAHEIKNPLTPMKLTLQHLDRIMDKQDESRKSLSTLLNQVDTLDQIVTSFSHFAKMPDPVNETFDILLELEKIIDLHPDKNIIFKPDDQEAMVNADRKLFGRIFNNLILNAFQAMSLTKWPSLIITVEKKDINVILTFKDNGIGISDNIKDKVFIPNFSTKDSGSGIGLAVAKRGIEHTGGDIWFESNTPQGTVFYIELPLV
ncbi:MAG: HAMP domain-containing histidine kinase, partial [Cyclobacteriaceae bacterium]|nr:HAMP domain-containing histidine kinase [Cyclobacteriaceae bacterium]